MGTFHQNKSALHGITVVVDTVGPKVYVGRCDDEDSHEVVLLDADVHEDGANGRSKAQYVERAAKFGVWKKYDHIVIPRGEVSSITKLGDVQPAPQAPRPSGSASAPAKASAINSSETTAATETATAVLEAPAASATEPLVKLTPSAQDEVRRLVAAENRPGIGLRLGVKGGGCSGFSYKLEFDPRKEGDHVIQYDGFSVFLDRKSTVYLRGIMLDYQKGLSGKGFVFHNPNATNTCGCGESFSI